MKNKLNWESHDDDDDDQQQKTDETGQRNSASGTQILNTPNRVGRTQRGVDPTHTVFKGTWE